MESVLKQLFYGKLFPYEHIAPSNPEFSAIHRQITGESAAWKEKLSAEDGKKLEHILELESLSGAMEVETAFLAGFRLGSMLMAEVFTGTGRLG